MYKGKLVEAVPQLLVSFLGDSNLFPVDRKLTSTPLQAKHVDAHALAFPVMLDQ